MREKRGDKIDNYTVEILKLIPLYLENAAASRLLAQRTSTDNPLLSITVKKCIKYYWKILSILEMWRVRIESLESEKANQTYHFLLSAERSTGRSYTVSVLMLTVFYLFVVSYYFITIIAVIIDVI